ncbi:LuxR family transcriptional regulator [Georgenia sp. SUBG003]|uniref:helix-turn-helix transcriptional regulator n=1 Tax=Georgenia sp. SUBG003 TaxID=1497974 RepID=UPI0006944C3A
MIRRSLAEVRTPARRVEVLLAAVEILLAVGDDAGTLSAAAELEAIGEQRASPVVQALAAHGRAQLDLAAGRPVDAPPRLRTAIRTWLRIGAPYEEARARVLLARACALLGDAETSQRETGVAREIFERLGADPDLRSLDGSRLLTERETEVLSLVVTGATNRAIAAELVLSERTVDRHVSNIFAKLGVSSRAAATARALELQLVPTRSASEDG